MREIGESYESLSFPGVSPEAYAATKATEQEYPEYGTPIDTLLERFKTEGMRIVMGKHPESGNVYVLPAQSTDIGNDSITPLQLRTSDSMDPKLKELLAKIAQLT